MIRILVLLCAAVAAESVTAELTAPEAVELALSRSELVTLTEARRNAALGKAEATGRWDNPEIEFSREAVNLGGRSFEDRFYWIRQRFNLARVHGLERAAANRQVLAETARTDFLLRESTRDLRLLFYRALAAQQRHQLLSEHAQRTNALSEDVAARVANGDAARYDQLRLERETASLVGAALQAGADAEAASIRLFALLSMEPDTLAGELLPPDPGAAVQVPDLHDHPVLRAIRAEMEAAGLSAQAARRSVWPELTVGVGRQETHEPGLSGDGAALSLALEIPLFDRGSGRTRAAEAEAVGLEAEAALATSRLVADHAAARRAVVAQRDAALGLPVDDSITDIAEAAYDEGELEVMALIDAQRSALALTRQRIDLALAARENWIELQHISGD